MTNGLLILSRGLEQMEVWCPKMGQCGERSRVRRTTIDKDHSQESSCP